MPNLLRLTRLLIPLLIFIIVVLFLWRGLHQDPRALPSTLIGKSVPDFALPRLNHPDQQLTQQVFVGHVSLLNVWATWCASCQAEHPVLMDIAHSNTVTLYGLNYKDQQANAQHWLQQYGNPYQAVAYDPQGQLGLDLGVYGTPETFLIDKKGVIRYRFIGPLDATAWQNDFLPRVQKLLAQR
ncbi:MAG: DsbE family thiol:disulfide interchange protein [Gammaproteobacteria bacterium]